MVAYEFPVFKGSPIVGKVVREIEGEFGVEVIHVHNPELITKSRTPPSPDTEITDFMYIKAEGGMKEIHRLTKEARKVF